MTSRLRKKPPITAQTTASSKPAPSHRPQRCREVLVSLLLLQLSMPIGAAELAANSTVSQSSGSLSTAVASHRNPVGRPQWTPFRDREQADQAQHADRVRPSASAAPTLSRTTTGNRRNGDKLARISTRAASSSQAVSNGWNTPSRIDDTTSHLPWRRPVIRSGPAEPAQLLQQATDVARHAAVPQQLKSPPEARQIVESAQLVPAPQMPNGLASKSVEQTRSADHEQPTKKSIRALNSVAATTSKAATSGTTASETTTYDTTASDVPTVPQNRPTPVTTETDTATAVTRASQKLRTDVLLAAVDVAASPIPTLESPKLESPLKLVQFQDDLFPLDDAPTAPSPDGTDDAPLGLFDAIEQSTESSTRPDSTPPSRFDTPSRFETVPPTDDRLPFENLNQPAPGQPETGQPDVLPAVPESNPGDLLDERSIFPPSQELPSPSDGIEPPPREPPRVEATDPPPPMPVDPIPKGELEAYNDRDCQANSESCLRDFEILDRRRRTDFSTDITPKIKPDEVDMTELLKTREEKLAKAPMRTWQNRNGRVLAEGSFENYENGKVYVRTRNGSIQSYMPSELSDEDWCFVTAWWELPPECRFDNKPYEGRQFAMSTFTWTAAATCHKPLYFEDVQLERYGHSAGPLVQPVLSGAHFFGSIALLPYKMGLNPPNECQYSLGYYRPGDCAPWLLHGFPMSRRGFRWQGLAAAAAITLLP